MANSELHVVQYRYYGERASVEDTDESAIDGNTLVGLITADSKMINILSGLGPAVKIGIQILPGTIFYLNSLSDGIIINHSGVYELDLRDTTTTITSLTFDPKSLANINNIDNASLIIDIMYKSAEGAVSN